MTLALALALALGRTVLVNFNFSLIAIRNADYLCSQLQKNCMQNILIWLSGSSPVILSQKRVNLGLIAREGFSNVSYIKKCALQHTKSLKKSE